MDGWIFIALPVAGILHILEEYVYPGGFADAFRKLLPRSSHLFTVSFHVIVNGIFVLLTLVGAFIGRSNLVISLSVYGLIFANAFLHIRGAIVTRKYYPGVISAVLIYIPLTVFAYFRFLSSKELTWPQAGLSFLLGVLYMVALMAYVLGRRASHPDQARPGFP